MSPTGRGRGKRKELTERMCANRQRVAVFSHSDVRLRSFKGGRMHLYSVGMGIIAEVLESHSLAVVL